MDLTIEELKTDKAGFEKMLAEQRQLLATTQTTILRLEGAHVYVTTNLERLLKEQEEKKEQEAKEE